ncbi:MAG: thiamine pyrophosphate-binding protein [Caldilineaceae bacterium]
MQSLINHGVDTIFGLPGVQNDQLYNALYGAGDQIRVIHRGMSRAAYMALGYALASDRVGVYSVVPGPGFLNTTAALSTAYATNARVLCLTGQIRSDQIWRGYGMLHEIPDQLTILRSLTKWAERVPSAADAPLSWQRHSTNSTRIVRSRWGWKCRPTCWPQQPTWISPRPS